MRLITTRSQIRSVLERWVRQYPKDDTILISGKSCGDITKELQALDLENATFGQVDKIIGNTSWTSVGQCNECGAENPPALVEVGEAPDYDSATAYLCFKCARRALRLFGLGS